ncbi:MAG: mannosyltransferase family protein [bacterium]|nr:mannosyltransferase family protein [bacterium]
MNPNTKTVISLLTLFLLFNFFISFIATEYIPYLGYYSYPELLDRWDLPFFIERFAGFDGLHYIKIALEGYERNATAFLPVFPMFMRFGTMVSGLSPILVGMGISIIALTIALMILPHYLKLINLKSTSIYWFLLFFLFFPTSFFLQGVYTESLFIMFLILTLYMAKKKRWILAALFGYFMGLGRITGFFLSGLIFLEVIEQVTFTKDISRYIQSTIKSLSFTKILAIIAPVLGFSTFMVYLWFTTGDPLRLAHSQVDFNQNRSASFVFPLQVVWRYLKIFYTAQGNFQYFIAVVEFVLTSMVVVILSYDAWQIYKKRYSHVFTRAGLNLFAWLSILLPISTGTLLSVPRFILPLFAVFIVLAELPNKWMKASILILFLILHTILLMAFIQGYFVS